jgi:hypothetical protein
MRINRRQNWEGKFLLQKIKTGRRSKMATGTQMQTAWALGIRDLAETLETHLAEVKHQGEMKLQHPEPLASGKLPNTLKEQAAATTTPTPPAHQSTRPPPCRPTRPLPHGPAWLLPTSLPPTCRLVAAHHRKALAPPDTGSKPAYEAQINKTGC